MKLLLALYRRLVRLYPAGFYQEMGAEMSDVFEDLLGEAADGGPAALARTCLRELRDLPRSVLQAYGDRYYKRSKEFLMAGNLPLEPAASRRVPSLVSGNTPGTWREALLAGLPHGLLALVLAVQILLTPDPLTAERWQTIETLLIVFAGLLGALLVGMVVLAWKRGWPRWSGSYYLYLFVLLASPALWLLQYQDTSWAYRGMDILLGLVYLLLLVGWVILVVRRDAVKGLLMLVPIAILSWWPVLEFIPSGIQNQLQLGMFLVATLAAILVARLGSWRLGIWTLITGSLLVGLPISYFRTFFHNIPVEYADAANLVNFAGRYSQAVFWSLILLVGPMLLWVLRELNRETQSGNRLATSLVFGGILLNLVANLTIVRGYSMSWLDNDRTIELIFGILILVSGLIYLAGVVLTLRSARQAGLLTAWGTRVGLGLAALGLPLMLMLPMFEGRRYRATSLPFGLFYENQVPDLWVFGIGVLWLVLAAWVVTQLRLARRPGPESQGAETPIQAIET